MSVAYACVPDRITWTLIAAMLLLFVLLQPAQPILIAPATSLLPLTGVALLICMRRVGQVRSLPNLVVAADGLLQMTLFTLVGILLSYTLAARGGALWDVDFAAWDAALGLDWPAIRAALDTSIVATWLLTIAYHSLIPQMVLVILLLSAAGLHDQLRTTVLAAVLAGFATILCSGPMPAMGNIFDADGYRHLPPSVAALHADIIAGLRDGTLRTIDLRQLMGIVTFPSYHAALALIFIAAFLHLPRFRIAGGAWAGLTIVATPVSGGHYGVDVLAGMALAVLALAAAHYLARARASSSLVIRERPGTSRFFASS
jgi:membrane-associated phospholipid phosphatase